MIENKTFYEIKSNKKMECLKKISDGFNEIIDRYFGTVFSQENIYLMKCDIENLIVRYIGDKVFNYVYIEMQRNIGKTTMRFSIIDKVTNEQITLEELYDKYLYSYEK